MRARAQIEAGTVTLDTGEVVPVVWSCDRAGEVVPSVDPACVVILAGPTREGKWLRFVVDPPVTFH